MAVILAVLTYHGVWEVAIVLRCEQCGDEEAGTYESADLGVEWREDSHLAVESVLFKRYE